MSRHAKNNTASAVFTYYERSQLKYGTQKQRLGKDSLKHFDACGLCLQPVIDPMACLQGHLYCKECIFENILAQKKEIKKNKKIFEEQQKELVVQEEEKRQQQKAEEIESFGKSEFGILSHSHQVFRPRSEDGETVQSSAPVSSSALVLHQSSKDNKDNKPIVSGAADPDKEKLKLNSFWVPSLTPSAAPKLLVKPKKDIMCIEGNHPIRLKQLIKVKFTLDNEKAEKNNSQNNRYCCPVCKRTLTDAPKAIVLKTCGHVLCFGCSEKFKNEKVCNVCDSPFRADHVILLQSGGTGFAGHDAKIMAKKEAVSAWV